MSDYTNKSFKICEKKLFHIERGFLRNMSEAFYIFSTADSTPIRPVWKLFNC